MSNGRNLEPAAPGISLVDIYFVLFRRKWLILFFTAIGVLAGTCFWLVKQPPFQSSCKLFIRYVTDSQPNNPGDTGQRVTSLTDLGQTVLNSEMQIMGSFDLFEQVATNIGPDKILEKIGGGRDPYQAASFIANHLRIEPSRESCVIQLTFTHPDQTVVAPVLQAIVDAYLDKHLQIHTTIGISEDLLIEKQAQLKQQIAQTDEELRMAKTNAGIIDLDASKKAYSDEIARIQRDLFMAQADLAEHQASFSEIAGSKKASAKITNDITGANISDEQLTRYKAACSRLGYLQKRQSEYIAQGYTEENKLVKEVQTQLAQTAKLKNDMEEANPALAALDFSSVNQNSSTMSASGSPSSTIQLTSLPTRIKTLEAQLRQVQGDASKLGDAEQKITALLRRKKMQEGFSDNIQATLDRTHINETIGGPGRVSNISTFQHPSPPSRDYKSYYKKVFAMMFGGLLFGLGLAFLLELYLDRTIKRPIEVQNKLKIPFFLSIPDLGQGSRKAKELSVANRKQLGYSGGKDNAAGVVAVKESQLEVMSWSVNRRFDSYYDALRDRLVVYFESINLTRKPKLVAVTSTHKGAGVSTIAAGLASSLSETGDGRVLLVDMNLENGAAQQFFRGQPNCKLDDALESETRDGARVQENLYVVTEDTFTDKLPRALPKRFASLIPKLKASDYDYIIFDMPPVSPTSVTARLSGFMDTVMLVIESEKTDQQVVQQANALLAQSKANVTAVLNKTKTYIPKQLHQDFLSEV